MVRGRSSINFRKVILTILVIAMTIIVLIPFINMLSTSFKTDRDILQKPLQIIPHPIILKHYRQVLREMPVGTYYFNSILVVSSIVVITLLVSSMAGYAFGKYIFPGRTLLFILLLSTIMIPFQVTMFPLFLVLRSLKGIDTRWGLMIPHLGSAFGTFLIRQYVQSIPDELLESARMDGASEFMVYRRIILPLCRPAMAVLTIFFFYSAWNDFLWPLIVIESASKRTVALLIETSGYFSITTETYWGPVVVLCIFMVAPIPVVFAFFQKYIVSGMTLTGFK